jgi:hypothetical protein
VKISELLDDVRKQNLVLPEFQREYVWRKEQAKQLMVSLFKGFPVGGVLFWKTKAPPKLKNVDELPETLGTVQVILDGQQRITTIYMLVTGEIPPFYRESDIENDPRDLYFNLSTGEFQYYQVSKMKGDPVWQRVVDCFKQKDINVFEIAKGSTDSESGAFELASSYNDSLNGLRNIGVVDLPEQVVPTHASLGEAIDIFDRVNSLGTKLTDAELALTHVTGKWADARRQMKEKIRKLEQKSFYFDLTFTTRALTGVVCRRALFETLHDRPHDEVIEGWDRTSRILDYLVSVLPARAAVHSTEDLNSTNTLIPLVVYLSLNDGRFPNEKAIHHAIHWLYAAHTWSRYTAQTDQRLEHDVTIMVREESPWEGLCAQIVDQRGRLEVKAADFEGRGALHPLYRMLFILTKTHQATDWFNGLPLGTTHGKRYRLHSHHIFPQSLLYRELYDVSSHIDRKKVNEVANRAFLTADTNQELSNRRPEEYLPEVLAKFPDALARQFIPHQPELWKVEIAEEETEPGRRAGIEQTDPLTTQADVERRIEQVLGHVLDDLEEIPGQALGVALESCERSLGGTAQSFTRFILGDAAALAARSRDEVVQAEKLCRRRNAAPALRVETLQPLDQRLCIVQRKSAAASVVPGDVIEPRLQPIRQAVQRGLLACDALEGPAPRQVVAKTNGRRDPAAGDAPVRQLEHALGRLDPELGKVARERLAERRRGLQDAALPPCCLDIEPWLEELLLDHAEQRCEPLWTTLPVLADALARLSPGKPEQPGEVFPNHRPLAVCGR